MGEVDLHPEVSAWMLQPMKGVKGSAKAALLHTAHDVFDLARQKRKRNLILSGFVELHGILSSTGDLSIEAWQAMGSINPDHNKDLREFLRACRLMNGE